MTIKLERPSLRRAEEFLAAVRRSRRLHTKLVTPPLTIDRYREFLKETRQTDRESFFVIAERSDELAGVINIGAIVRGYFQSAPLGYYSLVPNAGKGFMYAGLKKAIGYAFRDLKLHRLEANVQPTNERSLRLVQSLGFRLEGYSPKYLKISGRWQDHERWAVLAEEWPPRQSARYDS